MFLTSLTTFCGLIPLILETSEEAQFLIPMAFGILLVTLITMIAIPVLLGIRLDAWR